MRRMACAAMLCAVVVVACLVLSSCLQESELEEAPDTGSMLDDAGDVQAEGVDAAKQAEAYASEDVQVQGGVAAAEAPAGESAEFQEGAEAEEEASADVDAMRAALGITEDYRDSFVHGQKPAEYQKYIVLHDTEGEADGLSVVSYWDGSGAGVAAHFIVNMDGSIVQSVDMDAIAHHAGFGDTGHDDRYGVPEDGRDDRVGTQPIGDWAADYGMNSYSIGIEMVHVGGSGYYPEKQLQALDDLIAYTDAYYGGDAGQVIDHKAWRTGNSDTSPEFAGYLANYQDHRTHS
jgi:N-acetylmuramoyl-L-alanine amidase